MNIIINGYGVPKDIFCDKSYHSYLGQIFNFLWENYRDKKINIIFCGGNTDMHPHYHRTEAGEMYKWFLPRVKTMDLGKYWNLKKNIEGLSVLENLLTSQKLLKQGRIIYFCEKTRHSKSQRLAKEIFGDRARVMSIEFDLSPSRYDQNRAKLEAEDLKYSLKALKDKKFRNLLEKANYEKIKKLRSLPQNKRELMTDQVAWEIKQKYFKN